MGKTGRTIIVGILMGLLAVPNVRSNQRGPRSKQELQRMFQSWTEVLAQTDRDIREGRHAEAVATTTRIAAEMVDALGPGPNATYLLGTASAMRAIAEVGNGNLQDGLWFWRTACAIYQEYLESDLSVYGEAGRWLMEQPPVTERTSEAYRLPRREDHPENHKNISAPVLEERAQPIYPEMLRRARVQDVVIIECLVTPDGIPRDPMMVTDGIEAAMIYATLDAVRQWRFSPGTLDGKPVSVIFHLTMNFKLRQ